MRASRRSQSSPTSSDDAARYYPRLKDVPRRWVLVDAAPKILPEIPPRLGDYAAHELEQRGVEIHVNTTLESVVRGRGRALRTATRDPDAHTRLDCRGAARTRCCGELGLPLDERGRVEVDEFLRVGDTSTSGRSATARACRTRAARRPIRRPASTRSARRAGSRRTSTATCSHTATGCSARSRRSAATRASPTCSALRLRGFPGWFVTRSYHLYQLPLAVAEAARRRRLDDVAALPPRHRRARDARASRAARRRAQHGGASHHSCNAIDFSRVVTHPRRDVRQPAREGRRPRTVSPR